MAFIRAYLRASTKEQDALRARQALISFAADHDRSIASFYVENESGASLQRPELLRLIEDAGQGDIILVEQIDRLARLNQADWLALKSMLADKRLLIVSPELPTSWVALSGAAGDDFTGAIITAVNSMLLDMLAAVARKDYEDRRRRQNEGIKSAQAAGKYRGRRPNHARREQVAALLKAGSSYNDIQKVLSCSRHLIASVSKELSAKASRP